MKNGIYHFSRFSILLFYSLYSEINVLCFHRSKRVCIVLNKGNSLQCVDSSLIIVGPNFFNYPCPCPLATTRRLHIYQKNKFFFLSFLINYIGRHIISNFPDPFFSEWNRIWDFRGRDSNSIQFNTLNIESILEYQRYGIYIFGSEQSLSMVVLHLVHYLVSHSITTFFDSFI